MDFRGLGGGSFVDCSVDFVALEKSIREKKIVYIANPLVLDFMSKVHELNKKILFLLNTSLTLICDFMQDDEFDDIC